MRHPLKYLQRAGLLSTILIGGVVGGLTAPLPSEAGTPALRLQIDNQQQLVSTNGSTDTQVVNNNILGAKLSACSAADAGLGYTDCYGILTSTAIAYKANNGRLYRIQNAPNATARLRVADNAGLDGLSIAGVQFVPVNTANQLATARTIWSNGDRNINTNEEHKLVITLTQTFDSTRNTNNAGLQSVGLRTGGEFYAGPIGAVPTTTYCISGTTNVACDTVNDKVEYSGVGIFTPGGASQAILNPAGSSNNTQSLSKTIGTADKGKSKVSFGNIPYSNLDMAMVEPQYPRFTCNTGAGSTICNETLTQTMTVTLKGPDTFVATGTGDVVAVPCFAQDKSRLTFLVAFAKKAVAFLQLFVTTHPNNPNNPRLVELIDRVTAFLLTADVPTDPACPAAKLGLLALLGTGLQDAQQHLANGAVPSSPPVTGTLRIIKNTNVETSDTFTFRITGSSGSDQLIAMGNTNSKSIDVTLDAANYSVTEINLPLGWSLATSSCGGGGTENFAIPADSTITCAFNNTFTPPLPFSSYNGHDYIVINLPNASWDAARLAAQALGSGGGWDLATITSAGEQAFINSLLGPPPSTGTVQYWVGGYQTGTTEPGGDWNWINGEGMFWNNGSTGMFANWGAGLSPADEPNDCCSGDNGEQNHLALDNRYPVAFPAWGWDDDDNFPEVIRGYVAERVSP